MLIFVSGGSIPALAIATADRMVSNKVIILFFTFSFVLFFIMKLEMILNKLVN